MNDKQFEELKSSLQEATAKWKKDNPPKKFISESPEGITRPWERLPKEEYTTFMEKVAYNWKYEQFKEGYTRTYNEVLVDSWKLLENK